MKKFLALVASLFFALTGCSSQKIEEYEAVTPKMDIREYLSGESEAWGVLFDLNGKQDSHFHVTMKGTWKGNEGKLEEHFVFGDGRKDERIWTIMVSDDHNFTATAHDVVGKAIGTQRGNAVNMQYVLRVPREGSTIDLDMDDWMYRIDDKTVLNRTKMRKYGIQVGELMLLFRKK
jgi:hypothetical protein